MGLFSKKEKSIKNESIEAVLEDGSKVTITNVVDCIGDSCPRPQLMTKSAMKEAQAGDVVEVRIDNSTSVESLPPMMGSMSSKHLSTERRDRYWSVYILKE
jgi:tRNA 2-thiouridine synthesizing protein A